VPKCDELCGIFGTDMNQFIEEYVRERLDKLVKYDIEDVIENIYIFNIIFSISKLQRKKFYGDLECSWTKK
jgi:hypothetical protein